MDHMDSNITINTSVEVENGIYTNNRRLYTPPKIIHLVDSNIESGTTTNLVEASGGAWKAGS